MSRDRETESEAGLKSGQTNADEAGHDEQGINVNIAIIGAGTIGLSFAALHLSANPAAQVTIYDTRADLDSYVHNGIPQYLPKPLSSYSPRLHLATNLAIAVSNADIVQEQGPENLAFKTQIWPEIESHAPPTCLFWSSTSGIPASAQSKHMRDQHRLLVVHPYNPPHIMPLLEVVPSPETPKELIERTLVYWRGLGRAPVVIAKEVPGFVANRLAFALFREAIGLVHQGVISVEDCDAIVENSMGPRWSIAGPFKSYHAGGGEGGLEAFMRNIGGTVRECWSASESIKVGPDGIEEGWEESICAQTRDAYGVVDTKQRDRITKDVLATVKRGKEDQGQLD